MDRSSAPSGCSFLIRDVGSEDVFSPEKFSEEQRMFAATANEFVEREIVPHIPALEKQDFDRLVSILREAADVGLLMIDIPEEYGGLGVDKTTSMVVTENLSRYGAFATSFGAHTGIGTLPLLYFGNAEQKAKWLPKLATGEVLAAYALTEPGSGSDALAARTKAELSEDGKHYVLNGTKMWITNAGFADLFTVFGQVDGTKFTAFLVERSREGVSIGPEEHKMGIKGSSTCQVILENVKLPVENVLGEVGKGHKIAFNILNIGRFKLGVGVLGGCKRALQTSIGYAKERQQFGQAIAEFGAIRAKFGEMVARTWALESMCYRVAGYMDESLKDLDTKAEGYPEAAMKAIEEFAVEDSILKVYGSEVMFFVADECLQVHGGYGYSAEYEVERIFRDSRINRIFEGTNEINRMLIPGMILKRTMKGQLGLFQVIQQVEEALGDRTPAELPSLARSPDLALERFLTEQAKKVAVYASNQAIQKHMADLREQQEILLALADLMIAVFAMDSSVNRTLGIIANEGHEAAQARHAATRLTVATNYEAVRATAEQLFNHLATGDKLGSHYENLDLLAPRCRVDVVALRRELADAISARDKYPF